MKHLAAYLLLKLGGNAEPTKEDITQALSAVGVQVDTARLDQMMSDLQGKDLDAVLAEGKDMLATFGGGGGGGGGGAAAGGGGAGGAGAEETKEAPQEEPEDEPANLGGAMFGGDDGGGDY